MRPGIRHRTLLTATALIGWTAFTLPGFAQSLPQAPSSVAPQSKPYSIANLEYLLGPIALYPDPLLKLTLQASTVPDQVVAARQWIADNRSAVAAGDFSGADAMPWASPVMGLVRFPATVDMLAGHVEWTKAIGTAYLVQPDDVTKVIQMLRKQAAKAGNLKTSSQQVVTTKVENGTSIIYIAPANPNVIYVPTYDPAAVFAAPLAGALTFGVGVAVGAAWNNNWGWNHGGSWNNQVIINNNNYWQQHGGGWQPNQQGWQHGQPGGPQRPGGQPGGFGGQPGGPQDRGGGQFGGQPGGQQGFQQQRPPQQQQRPQQQQQRPQEETRRDDAFDREGGFDRDGGFGRDGFDREGGFGREGGFERGGGFGREGGFGGGFGRRR